MKRIDIGMLLSVLIIAIYWVIIIVFEDLTGPLVGMYYWIQGLSLLIGYPGAFLVSFMGNVTVLFPFPYIAVIFLLGGANAGVAGPFLFDPWLLGIVSGIGATLGEMTGYLLGRFGARFVHQEQRSRFLDLIHRYPRMTPIVLWFLAVTPLPDDVVIIPLGLTGYPMRKVIVPQFIGKCMFLIAIAWAGRLGLSFVESIVIGNPTSQISKSIEVIALLALLIAVYLVIRGDWGRFKFLGLGERYPIEEHSSV